MRRARVGLQGLNEEQRSAVIAESGPLLVLAGAGSGKTRVITHRIAHLIATGVAADRIVGITFTNKAAREMKQRLEKLCRRLEAPPWLSTFHSLGLRILREEHRRFGFRARFPIYDESDVRSVLTEEMRHIVGLDEAERNLDILRRRISTWKGRFLAPEDALEEADDDASYIHARIYARYRERLDGVNAVDFDDLIYRPVRLIEEDAEAREKWTQRFDCVLVDEYQDSNTAQFRFAKLLAGERENLTVVGDDDQSIYAFRGAEVEKILSFRRDFPRARVITLQKNYRSVGNILAAANAVIRNNSRRHEKQMEAVREAGPAIRLLAFEDEALEAEEAVIRAQRARDRGLPFREQAILLRSAVQARPLEEKLRFYQIPYTLIGARSFFDRREVRDVVAYLRVLAMPEDDLAALRVLNTPRRGWGSGSREKLDRFAREAGLSILDALRRVDDIPGVSTAARGGTREFLAAVDEARGLSSQGAVGAIRTLLDRIGYDFAIKEMSRDSFEVESRMRGVAGLIESIGRYEERNGQGRLSEYLAGITLDGREESEREGDEEDTLTLLTFHGAKGLEFRRVTLVGIEEGLIPHHRALSEDGERAVDEERRLFYVALTRARDRLLLTRALTRRRFGRVHETEESRFVAEIPEHLLEREEIRRGDDDPVDAATAADFLARMRAKFDQVE